VLEPAPRILGGDGSQACGDGRSEGFLCARFGFSQERLELGEGVFDGVEVRAVGGQEHQAASAGFDFLAHGLVFVDGKVVHDNDLAGKQRRAEHFIEIDQEDFRVGASFHDHRPDHSLGAHGCEDGSVAPAIARSLPVGAFSFGRIAVARA
jgi:hypothetical protein